MKALRETGEYIEKVMPRLHSFADRYELLAFALARARMKSGVCCEFGVGDGSTVNFLASLLKDETVYGFDSFEGLPEDWRDGYRKGHFLARCPRVRPNVQLVVGRFKDTVPAFATQHPQPIKFVHMDCDLYSSTRAVLTGLSDSIVPGTVIVFDEYFNYPGWKDGEFRAFQEFVQARGLRYEYLGYCRYAEQVALVVQPDEVQKGSC
ncbi:MAG: class I SAM-dependent methyltransferase [Armatimonadota bacterium]|nr:MAG: class I SAM-dependent methyltransferase [Armatimonadota bacterium]